MTEKRFILINCTKPGTRSNIFDYQKKYNEGVGDELWLGEVVDMLNQLTEENKQLKKENKELQQEIDDTWTKYENYHGMSIRNTEWY